MLRRLAMLLAAGALALTAGPILAHHSFAMFDRDNQVDLEGVVQEFRFVNPHTFIYLVVKQEDGSTVTWSLEGQSPAALVRGGWTSKTLKFGDELKMRDCPAPQRRARRRLGGGSDQLPRRAHARGVAPHRRLPRIVRRDAVT